MYLVSVSNPAAYTIHFLSGIMYIIINYYKTTIYISACLAGNYALKVKHAAAYKISQIGAYRFAAARPHGHAVAVSHQDIIPGNLVDMVHVDYI